MCTATILRPMLTSIGGTSRVYLIDARCSRYEDLEFSTESVQYYVPPMRSLPFSPPFANIESDVHNRNTDPRPGGSRPGPRGSRAHILEVKNQDTRIEDPT
eukprot:5644467-Pyramimonas_sp.AAC.1